MHFLDKRKGPKNKMVLTIGTMSVGLTLFQLFYFVMDLIPISLCCSFGDIASDFAVGLCFGQILL